MSTTSPATQKTNTALKRSSSWLIIACLIVFFVILATQQLLKQYYQTPLYEVPVENQLRFFTFI